MIKMFSWLSFILPFSFFLYIFSQSLRPINLQNAKMWVMHYYEKGGYEEDVQKIVEQAWKYLKTITSNKKSVILFDVDDTCLSTYQKAKLQEFAIPHFKAKDYDPAIKPVLELWKKVQSHGFLIGVLTGRQALVYNPETDKIDFDVRRATIDNLAKEGYSGWEKLIIRSVSDSNLTSSEFKYREIKRLIDQGYEIIAYVADQETDFNELTGYPVKLPNYLYGIS